MVSLKKWPSSVFVSYVGIRVSSWGAVSPLVTCGEPQALPLGSICSSVRKKVSVTFGYLCIRDSDTTISISRFLFLITRSLSRHQTGAFRSGRGPMRFGGIQAFSLQSTCVHTAEGHNARSRQQLTPVCSIVLKVRGY